MKKTITLALLLMLVLASVPVAFAHEHEEVEEIEEENEVKTSGVSNEGTSRGEKVRAERLAAKDAMLAKAREVREKLNVAKDEFKERREAMKETMKEIHEDFKEKRKELVQARQAFNEKRSEVKGCRGDKSEECVNVRSKAREHAGVFLARAVEEALKILDSSKERISAADISEELKLQLLANFDERIAKVKAIQAEVEALGEQSTAVDYREAAKKIRDVWQDSKQLLKRALAHANKAKLGNIARRLHQAEEKLEKVVERFSEQGSVPGVDESLEKVRVALARVDALNAELQQILAGDLSMPEKMKAATEKMREANAALKEVHQLIKDLLAKLHEARNAAKPAAETNV